MVDLGVCALDDGPPIAIDLCVSDCGTGSPPRSYMSGAKCEAKGKEKRRKYVQRFPDIPVDELCCPSYGRTGSKNREAVILQKRIINALAAADKTVHRSLVAARVGQAISIAIQRAVAFNILEFRYTTLPMGRGGLPVQPVVVGGEDWEDDGVPLAGAAGAEPEEPVPLAVSGEGVVGASPVQVQVVGAVVVALVP